MTVESKVAAIWFMTNQSTYDIIKTGEIFRFSDNFPTNFQTFSIKASIFLKLWRGRCSGGWLEGKEWATLTTSPDRIGLYCGRSYSEVAMRLLARKWKSQMQNRFFFLFLVVIVWHNPRTISWYSQILWCYFCNYWQQHTRFPFAKYSDCQFYKEGEGSLCAIFFI